jgi:hypothetical protein
MKRVFTFLLSFLLVAALYAQKPSSGFGVSAGLSSIAGTVTTGSTSTGSLGFRYVLSESMMARFSVNLGQLGGNGYMKDSTLGIEYVSKITGLNYSVNLGIQKSIAGGEKFDTYVAFDLLYHGQTRQKSYNSMEVLTTVGGNVGDKSETTSYGDKNTTMGVVASVGCAYYILENFSIGAEFGYGVAANTWNEGGESTTTNTGSTFGTAPTATTNGDAIMRTTGMSTTGGCIMLSWYF